MRRVLSGIVLLVTALCAWSVPARREGVVRVQSDGSTVTVYQHGDEAFHYMTNAAGEWLAEDARGDLYVIDSLSASEIAERKARSPFTAQQARRVQAMTNLTGANPLLAPRGPVILVNFKDVRFQNTRAEMTAWAMGTNYRDNGATGSVHQYFMDASYGKYNLQLDVYDTVTVSREYAYYGEDKDYEGDDKRADELVVEACRKAAQKGVDFSRYDYDRDGEVDWVVILYAGKGQADGGSTNTIWPHQFQLAATNKSFKLNGKTINHYCCVNELDNQSRRCGIGTFCHEFSHIMGLPDLYTTNGKTYKTLGKWDLMDYGPYNNNGRTPPSYSAYERWWMGWLQPTALTQACSVTMGELNSSQGAAYLTSNGSIVTNILSPYPSDFYVLENRQKTGWDFYLPGAGLLITHIHFRADWWVGNSVNNSEASMGVDLIEADGKAPSYQSFSRANGYFGKAADAFPAGATEWTALSGYPVTEIRHEDGFIYFDLQGGGNPVRVAIENVEAPASAAHKILRDGKIYLMYKGTMYNVQGTRIQ